MLSIFYSSIGVGDMLKTFQRPILHDGNADELKDHWKQNSSKMLVVDEHIQNDDILLVYSFHLNMSD